MNDVSTTITLIFTKKRMMKALWMKKKAATQKQFKLVGNELPKWLELKNDFNEAKKFIDNIRIDIIKVKVS